MLPKKQFIVFVAGLFLSYGTTIKAENNTGYPGISLGSPIGYGLNSGDLYLGGGADDIGTAAAIAFGVGHGKTIGAQVDIVLASVDPRDGGFAADGVINLKLHKTSKSGLTSVALGIDSVSQWGEAKRDEASNYLSLSKIFVLENHKAMTLTVGIGDGRFAPNNSPNTMKPFAAISYLPNSRMNFILDYNSDILKAGVSFVPTLHYPLTITVYADDLEQKTENSTGGISFGYSFKY